MSMNNVCNGIVCSRENNEADLCPLTRASLQDVLLPDLKDRERYDKPLLEHTHQIIHGSTAAERIPTKLVTALTPGHGREQWPAILLF